MKTYIVAYISFHDNEMKMERVMAHNEFNALLHMLKAQVRDIINVDCATVEDLKSLAFDCDSMIGAFEI